MEHRILDLALDITDVMANICTIQMIAKEYDSSLISTAKSDLYKNILVYRK